jgi:hypothetical protein
MKPDGMIVEPEYLARAHEEIVRAGANAALKELNQSEPAMAVFLHDALASIVGKLVLTGAPAPVVRCAHNDMLSVVLTCVRGLRRGHYELWKDCMGETEPDQVRTPTPERPKSGRKRKKPEEGPTGRESA